MRQFANGVTMFQNTNGYSKEKLKFAMFTVQAQVRNIRVAHKLASIKRRLGASEAPKLKISPGRALT
jgi:hypothetical protein